MAMKQTNSKANNIFGQPRMFELPSDDRVGKDYILPGKFHPLGISYRWRGISLSKYHQISIRAKVENGLIKCEIDKLCNGRTKALLYIFEFKDAWVVCRVADIAEYLKSHKLEIIPNKDTNKTSGCYIDIEKLPHLLIDIR